jgi:glutathione peroxidase
MTVRQKILKSVYPIIMGVNNLLGNNNQVAENVKAVKPLKSFYDLESLANDSSVIHFSAFAGKKVLLVNTASECGYTGQYAELEKLYQQYKGRLIILGFPANDFKNQEKGDDAAIASFCKLNYGISFPLMRKSQVVKGERQNKVYQWLTSATGNGWNNRQPDWNFSKYLVNEEGVLTNYFSQNISPLDELVIKAIEQ